MHNVLAIPAVPSTGLWPAYAGHTAQARSGQLTVPLLAVTEVTATVPAVALVKTSIDGHAAVARRRS